MKKLLSIILAAIMLLAVVPVASFAEDEVNPNEPIETVETVKIDKIVIDFIYPEFGEAALTDYFLENTDCDVVKTEWFEASSDKFIDDSATFSEGIYYMQVTFSAQEGAEFTDDVEVTINGKDALNVEVNSDGTVTAIAEFTVEKDQPQIVSIFQRLIDAIKTVFLAIVHFFGTMVGLK